MTDVTYAASELGSVTATDQPATRTRRLIRLVVGLGITACALVVLVGVAGPFFHSPAADSPRGSGPAVPTDTATQQGSGSAPPAPAPTTTDSRGFVNSFARCEGDLTAVVLARTAQSLVAICAASPGRYLYRGLRVSSGVGVSLDGVAANPNGFVARNYAVTYTVSSTELLITSGTTVIAREPMVEFQDLRGGPTTPQAPLPAAPTPTQPAPAPVAPPPPPPVSTEAVAPFVRGERKVGRNESCPCGSGKKYKHCHGALSSVE